MKKTLGAEDDSSVPIPSPKTFPRLEELGNRTISALITFFKSRKRDGRKQHHIENPLIFIYRYLGQKPFSGYHLFLLAMVVSLGVGTNFANAQVRNFATVSTNDVTIDQKAKFTANIDNYTPTIQEDPASIILASALEETSGYYSLPLIASTNVSEQEVPAPSVPAERTKTTTYVVETDDTLSTIGWEYGLKVATIQFQNKLTSESIKPGQKLLLPPGDISATVIAKAKAKQEADQKKKLLAKTTSRTVTVREKASDYAGDESDGNFVKPANYSYISRRLQKGHMGTDMVTPVGTTVVAAQKGKIVDISYGWSGGYGLMVLIDHGGGLKTRYAHLSSIKVSAGDIIDAGQVIAASGNTGRSTGPHLHFEVIKNGHYLAPF
jgi:LysM repeat protein